MVKEFDESARAPEDLGDDDVESYLSAGDLFPPPPSLNGTCKDGVCSAPAPANDASSSASNRPLGGGNNYYGLESSAVARYRSAIGAPNDAAGGNPLAFAAFKDGEAKDGEAKDGEAKDGKKEPAEKPVEKPAPVAGQEVFEGDDVAKAMQYAKENNLPVFVRMSADWCGPCNQMKPMWNQAQKDLKGNAVFLHVDADKYGKSEANGGYSDAAKKLLKPIVDGTASIPAVWSGAIGADGAFAGTKLANPRSVSTELAELKKKVDAKTDKKGEDGGDKVKEDGDKPPVKVEKDVYDGDDAAKALKFAKDNNLPVFFRMEADWCGPCRGLKPMWDAAQKDLKGKAVFIKVDADRALGLNGKNAYSAEAMKVIAPVIQGVNAVPAIWSGPVKADGTFDGKFWPDYNAIRTEIEKLKKK